MTLVMCEPCFVLYLLKMKKDTRSCAFSCTLFEIKKKCTKKRPETCTLFAVLEKEYKKGSC